MSKAKRAVLPPGTIIAGRYRIEGTVGRGGFGAVYDATQLDSGRRVALKVLLKNFSTSKTDARRFQREAALVQKLRHPNVVEIFDFGYTGQGQPYIAFELLQGTALGDCIKQDGALDFVRACDVARDVLKALSAAHAIGIIHRDIKPQNIFLCAHGPAKVLDFGIAKAVRGKESQATQLTETGQMLGTPQYMAPEQVRGADIVPGTDVYALGLLFAEMISGERVVAGGALIDVYMAHISDDPFELPPAVTNSPVGNIIARAISKPLEGRYSSASDMLAELETATGNAVAPLMTSNGTTEMAAFTAQSRHDPLNSTVLMMDQEDEDEDSLAATAYQPSSSDGRDASQSSRRPSSSAIAHGTVVMDSGDHLAQLEALKLAAASPPSVAAPQSLTPSLAGTVEMSPMDAGPARAAARASWAALPSQPVSPRVQQTSQPPVSQPPVTPSAQSLRSSLHEGMRGSMPEGSPSLSPEIQRQLEIASQAPRTRRNSSLVPAPAPLKPKPNRTWVWLVIAAVLAVAGAAFMVLRA